MSNLNKYAIFIKTLISLRFDITFHLFTYSKYIIIIHIYNKTKIQDVIGALAALRLYVY